MGRQVKRETCTLGSEGERENCAMKLNHKLILIKN